MDQAKAAQYMVVGWVKDWSLATYADVVGEHGAETLAQMIARCPWLPSHESWWPEASMSASIRRFMATAYPVTNGRIWECSDNAARLRLAPEIQQLRRFEQARGRVGVSMDVMRRRADAAQTHLKVQFERENYRRSAGHHWSIVK